MAERQRKAPNRPAAERYFVQHLSLSAAEGSTDAVLLQEAINQGAEASWKLVSMVKEPSGEGLFLVWDTSGFFSG